MMIGDASKERLIAVFFDHLIALGLVFVWIAFVPESLPALKHLNRVLIQNRDNPIRSK